MISYSNQDKQKIIFEAYTNPKFLNKDFKDNEHTIKEHSGVCVDDIKLNLYFDGEKLIKAEYIGDGCSIFKASVELILEKVLNKDKKEILEIIDTYFKMINGENISEAEEDLLEKLNVFKNVKIHLNRLECASIMCRAIKKGL
ncbi:iron-sulfur cluster assembly scaffold protein [Metamycoplasma neophronis]|uniref:Iron-sulfur cluster assembly scaffold protein n=1 Tax=Metamycoplasma neophronis TaxID=872983 RepID=A0ABY2Z0E5_9BACT|nr:iron-sulfur cluster assembly scaffold protein [Metamycoplasma neophronis]TPR54356.1 iron-sulfur cluster assembly scaffold protein [Metamycoplasma neophronis]